MGRFPYFLLHGNVDSINSSDGKAYAKIYLEVYTGAKAKYPLEVRYGLGRHQDSLTPEVSLENLKVSKLKSIRFRTLTSFAIGIMAGHYCLLH